MTASGDLNNVQITDILSELARKKGFD